MGKIVYFLEKNKGIELGRAGPHVNWVRCLYETLHSNPNLESKIEREVRNGIFDNTSSGYTELRYILVKKAGPNVKRSGRSATNFLNKIFIKKYIPQYLSYYVEKENLD